MAFSVHDNPKSTSHTMLYNLKAYGGPKAGHDVRKGEIKRQIDSKIVSFLFKIFYNENLPNSIIFQDLVVK